VAPMPQHRSCRSNTSGNRRRQNLIHPKERRHGILFKGTRQRRHQTSKSMSGPNRDAGSLVLQSFHQRGEVIITRVVRNQMLGLNRLGIDVYVRSMTLARPLGWSDVGVLEVLPAVTDEWAFPTARQGPPRLAWLFRFGSTTSTKTLRSASGPSQTGVEVQFHFLVPDSSL
jgi:hypothetical protein